MKRWGTCTCWYGFFVFSLLGGDIAAERVKQLSAVAGRTWMIRKRVEKRAEEEGWLERGLGRPEFR
ncbi:hypothetical protein CEF21_14700 [Bacillus sp. FJAT-42376]|nr:hypothetical protein CEF21_14700 [Bacillus sp. FJAT-42376]